MTFNVYILYGTFIKNKLKIYFLQTDILATYKAEYYILQKYFVIWNDKL